MDEFVSIYEDIGQQMRDATAAMRGYSDKTISDVQAADALFLVADGLEQARVDLQEMGEVPQAIDESRRLIMRSLEISAEAYEVSSRALRAQPHDLDLLHEGSTLAQEGAALAVQARDELETVISSQRRAQLATAIATLMDSPGLTAGRGLTHPDIESLLFTTDGSPAATVIALELGSAHIRQFVTAVLVAKLGTFVRSRWRSGGLHLLVVVDEGGAVLPRGEPVSTTEPLLTIMDSWRGHGVALALVAEEPAQLNDRALDLCQTWVVGRVPAARARQSVVDALDLINPPVDEVALDEVVKHLAAGQFVLRSPRLDSLEYFKTDDE